MNQKIKTLKIIHFSICIGMVMCYTILGQLTTITEINLKIQTSDLIYLLIPISAIGIGNFLFNNQLKQINSVNSDKKFAIYQSASIIRWALIEGAALLILIIYPHLLIFGILLIVYLFFLYPSTEKIERILYSNNH